VLCVAAAFAVATPVSAHEPTQTHRRLTLAGLSLISADFFRYSCPSDKTPTGTTTGCSVDGFTEYEIARELTQGAIDEDLCIGVDAHGMDWEMHVNFYNHLWDVTQEHEQDWPAYAFRDCSGKDWTQQTPPERAQDLWKKATGEYGSGNKLGLSRARPDAASAGGHDPPAHVHADPHGWPTSRETMRQ
jgi:hypothetical protein